MLFKGLSLLFLGFGVFLLMQVVLPFLSYKTWELASLSQNISLVDPNPKGKSEVMGVSIEDVGNFPAIIAKDVKKGQYPYKQFSVSIPKIGLEKTPVQVSSNDFEENLAHLPGTSLPGERGNVFVSGHSSLQGPITTKRKAYFIKLPDVKKGDEIVVEALGQRFSYEVTSMKVVEPSDMSVVEPPDKEGRYLTLMTCVPPGFNTKRLIVLAKLKG